LFCNQGRETKIVEISVMRKNFLRGISRSSGISFFLYEIDMLMYGVKGKEVVFDICLIKRLRRKKKIL